MKSHFAYVYGSIVFCLVLSLCLLSSCSSEEPVEVEKEEDLVVLSQGEEAFISNLLLVQDEMSNIWKGFDCLEEFPIFILTDADSGVFINPPASVLAGSKRISSSLPGLNDLALYRNKDVLESVKEHFTNSPIFFGFLEQPDYTLYAYHLADLDDNFYNNYKNRNGHFHVSIFFHELFHAFQLIKNGDRFFGDFGRQDFAGYPLTDETMPLLLLLFDVMIDAYHSDGNDERTLILSYYVAIQAELERMDTSANNLIRTHGFYLEKLEGSARYVEVFGTLNSIENNTIEDPTHGFKEFANNLVSSAQVRQVYARRIFYHTGAGAIHLLKALGYAGLEDAMLIPTNTPYDIASSFLGLPGEELSNVLEQAKARYDWGKLLERSDVLLGLP